VDEEYVESELVYSDEQESLHNHTVSPAVAKCPKLTTNSLRRVESDSNSSASDLDSDVLFGQFVAAELRAISDPIKKSHTKLQIHTIINRALSEC